MDIVDSIRDTDAIEEGEEKTIVREETAISMIELRKASEIEQKVRWHTGNPQKALTTHPDGLKQDGDDRRSDILGKAYTKVRKTKPTPGKVNYIRTVPLRPVPEDIEEVEVASHSGETMFVLMSVQTRPKRISKKWGAINSKATYV
jgi:hypothetical protein